MSPGPAGSFLAFAAGPLEARIYENSGHIQLAGPDLANQPLANVITFDPPSVTVAGAELTVGRVLASQPVGNGHQVVQALGGAQVTARLTFAHDWVMRYEVVDWGGAAPSALRLAGAAVAGEHFYGFGEKFNTLDQTGKQVDILTFDAPGPKGDHAYKPMPWFLSTRGYGVHLDSSAESLFDMRAGAGDRFVITQRLARLKVNVVYGPQLPDVLRRFTQYSGRPPVPPPWVFGTWISSDIWRNGGEVRYAVSKYLERGIAASVFVFDSPWETAYNDFTFNMTQFGQGGTFEGVHFDGFASVAEMMEFLRGHGLKVICWMTPFINKQSNDEHVPGQNLGQAANYDAAANSGFFVRTGPGGPPLVADWWKGRGSPVDFTNPAAIQWLTGQLQALVTASQVVTASGVREPVIGGFKTDDGETGNGTNTYIPATAAFADGRRGDEMQNGYCVEYQKAIWNVLGAAGTLLARSGFTGTPAFPACWAGDNEPNFGEANGLPSVIVAGLSAALSGFALWGHDIGGYQNTHFSPISPANLFMRWTQFGCFSPIMQMHRQVALQDPADLRQYPWGYGAAALANFQFFADLHTRLFPYLYTYAHEASTIGLPILRPLVLVHQDDPRTYSIEHTYYFGNEFLVAPVIAPTQAGAVTERVVYLPKGTWFDFWTQEQHAGQQEITWRNGNQQQLPLFVREGAMVPLLLQRAQTLCEADYVGNEQISTRDSGLAFLIYPAADSSFTVYDGTSITCQMQGALTTLTLTSTPRRILLQVFGAQPASVQRDGTPVEQAPTRAAFDAADSAWHFDAASRFVFVKFSHQGPVGQIVLAH